MTSCSKPAKPVATTRGIRTAPDEWLPGLRPGKLVIMHATIPTYALYGIEAIPADVVVEPGGVRVVERGTGRTLFGVKRESRSCTRSGVQGCAPILGRRELAPEAMSTSWSYLSFP
jgi:hypothetical protein